MQNIPEAGDLVTLVFLTDIHATGAAIPRDRVHAMAAALHSVMTESDQAILVLGGDVAFSGQAHEYEAFAGFLADLDTELRARGILLTNVVSVPGNHDCDFGKQNPAVRKALLGAATADSALDLEIVNELTSVQAEYRRFESSVVTAAEQLSKLQTRVLIRAPSGATVSFDCINSAWASTLNEQMGKLHLPVNHLQRPENSDFAFAVMHHPPNWFEAWNQRAVLRWLDENVDAVLFGHEHQRETVERIRREVDAHLLVIFGPEFAWKQQSADSGFSVHQLDLKKRELISHEFALRNGVFHPVSGTSTPISFGNSARSRGKLRCTDAFEAFLDDPGVAFKHQKVNRPIRLEDLYVVPDLRRCEVTGSANATIEDTVNRSETVSTLLGSTLSLVAGVEQAGKTSLAKLLYRESQRRGDVPLYLDCSRLSKSFRGEITSWINSAMTEQYPSDCAEDIKQATPTRKIAFLDNVHSVPGGHEGLKRVVDRLSAHHGRIVAFSGQYSAISGVVDDLVTGASNVWRDAALFELPPTSHKHRSDLIRRWVSLGDDGEFSEVEIESQCRQLKKFVDELFARNIIPRYPVYVLLVLQQLELASDAKSIVANGSHGYLFEELITRTIDERVKGVKIEIVVAVLSAFARRVSEEPSEAVTQEEFDEFYESFLKEKRIEVDRTTLVSKLVSAQILAVHDGVTRFYYPYYFYYFLARDISAARNRREQDELIPRLIEYIHTERSANVLTFVAHLGHETEVVDLLCRHANALFPEIGEAEVSEGTGLLTRFLTVADRSVLIDGRPIEVSEHFAEQADKAERQSLAPSHRGMEGLEDDPGRINSAFKTIQVLGQVLRSRAGGLDGERKMAVASSCSSLARRLMRLFFQLVEEHGPQIAHQMSGALEASFRLDPEVARQTANRVLGWVVSQMTLACVSRVATAIGAQELRPLVADMRRVRPESTDMLFWLGAGILSEKDFPGIPIEKFLRETREADLLPRIVVRELVKRRMYLSPPDTATKRKYCQLLGLEIRQLPSRGGRKQIY